MKVYQGLRRRDGCEVTVNGNPLRLADGFPGNPAGGFEWGYDGAGPSRLAYAILADHLGDTPRALAEYRLFLANFIAGISGDSWSVDSRRVEELLGGSIEVPLTLAELMNRVRSS